MRDLAPVLLRSSLKMASSPMVSHTGEYISVLCPESSILLSMQQVQAKFIVAIIVPTVCVSGIVHAGRGKSAC